MSNLFRSARRYGPLILAVALLGWVFRSVSLGVVWATLAQLQPYEIAILLLANSLLLVAMTARWWLFLLALGYRIPYLRLTGYRLTAFGISYFTPGPHFGGEPYQVFIVAKRHNVSTADAIASVSLDKLLELLVNFSFLAGAAIFVVPKIVMHGQYNAFISAFALALVCMPAAVLVALRRGAYPFSRTLAALHSLWHRVVMTNAALPATAPPRWLQTVRSSEDQVGHICRTHPLVVLAAFAVSVLTWFGMIAEFWLMTYMLEMDLSLLQALTSLLAARVAILLPFPAAVGALEASQALAISAVGLQPGAGVGLSILIRSRDIFFGVLGLMLGGANVWKDIRSSARFNAGREAALPDEPELHVPYP